MRSMDSAMVSAEDQDLVDMDHHGGGTMDSYYRRHVTTGSPRYHDSMDSRQVTHHSRHTRDSLGSQTSSLHGGIQRNISAFGEITVTPGDDLYFDEDQNFRVDIREARM